MTELTTIVSTAIFVLCIIVLIVVVKRIVEYGWGSLDAPVESYRLTSALSLLLMGLHMLSYGLTGKAWDLILAFVWAFCAFSNYMCIRQKED
jgi:hypothetical protein